MSIGAAKITAAGKLIQLNPKAEPDAVVTEADVQSPHLLAKLLTGILTEIVNLRRRYAPRHIDFEDITIASGGKTYTFRHGFNGRVRWWVVDYENTGATVGVIVQKWAPLTDANTLGIYSNCDGRITLRVQEAG